MLRFPARILLAASSTKSAISARLSVPHLRTPILTTNTIAPFHPPPRRRFFSQSIIHCQQSHARSIDSRRRAISTRINGSNDGSSSAFSAFYTYLQQRKNQKQQQQQQQSNDDDDDDEGAIDNALAERKTRQRAPPGFWRNIEHHKLFLDWAGKQLGISSNNDNDNDNNNLDGWYTVIKEDVEKLGGCGLLHEYYNNSLQQALSAVYPHHEWLPWRFQQASKSCWRDPVNHKRFFDWAGKQLGLCSSNNSNSNSNNDNNDNANNDNYNFEGWYSVTTADISKLGGFGLLQGYYNGSLQQALAAVYPQHEWLPWKFQHTGNTFWRDPANHERFLNWAGKQLGVQHLDDWYAVINDDVEKLGGGGLLREYYNGSLQQALAAVYPQHEWLPWRFHHTSKTYWQDRANHKRFFDWAGEQLGINSNNSNNSNSNSNNNNNNLDEWYDVIGSDVEELGGGGLLQGHYNNSLPQALAAVYPHHAWQPWRFRTYDTTKLVDVLPFVEHLAEGLGIRQLDDWYRISQQQIRDVGGYRALRTIKHNGGLYAMLRRLYPHHAWAADRFEQLKGKKAAQRWLLVLLQKLFPNAEIIEEYTHPTLKFTKSGRNLTLDVYIPSLALAFEYQGMQHYREIRGFFDDVKARQEREAEKSALCAQSGITIIHVPYWWSRTTKQLTEMIRAVRPELFEPSTTSSGNDLSAVASNDDGDVLEEASPYVVDPTTASKILQ